VSVTCPAGAIPRQAESIALQSQRRLTAQTRRAQRRQPRAKGLRTTGICLYDNYQMSMVHSVQSNGYPPRKSGMGKGAGRAARLRAIFESQAASAYALERAFVPASRIEPPASRIAQGVAGNRTEFSGKQGAESPALRGIRSERGTCRGKTGSDATACLSQLTPSVRTRAIISRHQHLYG